jgi:DHA2 family methylenomycin A resistance protein-like MFS transporter
MLAGLGGGGAGAVLLATAGDGSTAAAIACSVPLGTVALAMQAMTAVAMEEAPASRIGLASGIQNTSRQAGGALGVALLGTLLSAGGELSLGLPMAAVAAAFLAAIWLTVAARGQPAQAAARVG